jgi:hypothetical protein
LRERNEAEIEYRKQELEMRKQQLKPDEEKFELEKKERMQKLENEKHVIECTCQTFIIFLQSKGDNLSIPWRT